MSNSYRPSSRIYHKYNSKSLTTSTTTSSSTNILSLTPSTPYSDQNDEIWIEFLNSLNQQTPDIANNSDLNTEPLSVCSSKLDEQGQVVDQDDAQEDDPDFTVCLENCDFDDPDYDMDKWFQIPKKEAVELVKDAIEICDGAPIVYEDQRHSKIKSANTIKKISELKSKINQQQQEQPQLKTIKQNLKQIEIEEQKPVELIEFIPEITELEKKQLDEQLRNHVQLLTQTCLVSYCSKEYKHIFTEAYSLLNVLKSLNNEQKDNNDQILPLSNFEIINLNESLDIVNQIQTMSEQELQFDQKQGIPNKFLEIIIKSPVFYNTNIVPNLSKFKYQSHFKRAQFTDTEKILLIMGFNKFKHLPKSECCECIKEHLLPNRCCDDIRKQLNYLSNSEQRQIQLADLMRKQKKLMTNLMHNYEFVKEVHYKSPFEQADNVQLPSQYTIIIERIKLANLLKETRKNAKQEQKKTDKKINDIQIIEPPTPTPSSSSSSSSSSSVSILSKEIKNIELNNRNSNKNQFIRYNQIQKIRPQITKVVNPKRQRSPSPKATTSEPTSIQEQQSPPLPSSPQPIIIEKEIENDNSNEKDNQENQIENQTSPPRSPSPIIISSASNSPLKENSKTQQNKTQINNNKNNNNSIPILTALPSSPIILPNNFIDLFTRPNVLTNSNILRPLTQIIPISQFNGKNFIQMPLQQQQQQLQTPPPVYLPANFGGTILIQPTIHIHTNSKNLNLTKYCQIKPKQTTGEQTNSSKKKKI